MEMKQPTLFYSAIDDKGLVPSLHWKIITY